MSEGTAVWMYGSFARDDADEFSDLDILVVGRDDGSLVDTVREGVHESQYVAVSNYSWQELEDMASYGSLFLHHLRLEGRPLVESKSCEGDLGSLLRQLGPYTRVLSDLSAFKAVLADVEESLPIGDVVTFELSVLATVTRHASILGCWVLGTPCFSRTVPVERFANLAMRDPRTLDSFGDLYAYRLYSDGRITKRELVTVSPFLWLRRAKALVAALEEVANGLDNEVLKRH